jgi:hypothetical protein
VLRAEGPTVKWTARGAVVGRMLEHARTTTKPVADDRDAGEPAYVGRVEKEEEEEEEKEERRRRRRRRRSGARYLSAVCPIEKSTYLFLET